MSKGETSLKEIEEYSSLRQIAMAKNIKHAIASKGIKVAASLVSAMHVKPMRELLFDTISVQPYLPNDERILPSARITDKP